MGIRGVGTNEDLCLTVTLPVTLLCGYIPVQSEFEAVAASQILEKHQVSNPVTGDCMFNRTGNAVWGLNLTAGSNPALSALTSCLFDISRLN